jgi:hypothetical protein
VDWIRLGQDKGPVVDTCEYGNEYSGPIKGGKFIDKLSNYQLLKND